MITKDFLKAEDRFNQLIYHTVVRDTKKTDSEIVGSLILMHGFGESSDFFLEPAINYALNGLDVHLIDLRGFGQSSGPRCGRLTIKEI